MFPEGTEPFGKQGPKTVVLDTCVLLNFIAVARIDLLDLLSPTFLVPEYVSYEVVEPDESAALEQALALRIVSLTEVSNVCEEVLLSDLRVQGLGLAERSAMAVAMCRGVHVGTDDGDAIKVCEGIGYRRIVRTQDLMLMCIRENHISVKDADEIKRLWDAHHSFTLKIGSFAELGV